MNLQNFIAGISIARSYYDKPDGHHIGAEHDIFYLYMTDHPMKPEDVERMRELGWFQEGRGDRGYSPDDGWAAFT